MHSLRRIGVFLLSLGISAQALAVPFPGPDGFGYNGRLIPLNLRDVSTSGANLGLDDADDAVTMVAIGFSFTYYGAAYTQVEVSSNGFMTFSPTGSAHCCSGETIPSPGNPDNFIAGFWQDLDPSEGLPVDGLIRAQTLGSPGSRQFVVGFYVVSDNDDPSNVINTFELILHEGSNDVELQILELQFDNIDDKVTGIENSGGTDGIEVMFVLASDPGFSNGDPVIANQGFCFSTGNSNCNVPLGATGALPIPTLSLGSVITMIALLLLGALVPLRRWADMIDSPGKPGQH